SRDWSSDVCSSDLGVAAGTGHTHHTGLEAQCAQLAAQTGRRTAIAVRVVEVAALQDEIRLDAMEREAAESSRPRIIEQCGHGEWGDERIQLHDERTVRRPHLEPRTGAGLREQRPVDRAAPPPRVDR